MWVTYQLHTEDIQEALYLLDTSMPVKYNNKPPVTYTKAQNGTYPLLLRLWFSVFSSLIFPAIKVSFIIRDAIGQFCLYIS